MRTRKRSILAAQSIQQIEQPGKTESIVMTSGIKLLRRTKDLHAS